MTRKVSRRRPTCKVSRQRRNLVGLRPKVVDQWKYCEPQARPTRRSAGKGGQRLAGLIRIELFP